MNTPQALHRRVVRVVIELDVVLTAPSPDEPIPKPVVRLIEKLLAGEAADQESLRTTALYAALSHLDSESDLTRDLLGSAELENLIPALLNRSSGEEGAYFDRVLRLEEERNARRLRHGPVREQEEEDEADKADPPSHPDVLNDNKGWYNEVETFLSDHWSAEVVGVEARISST